MKQKLVISNHYNNYQFKIQHKLDSLNKSKFRNSFFLEQKDIVYIKEKGIGTIKRHASDFVNQRLAPATIPNDGKQTPMRGHPVFIAQHATATCCRKCLQKWHYIQANKELTEYEKLYIIDIIMGWINKQYKKGE